jgi:prefoldin subunit 5
MSLIVAAGVGLAVGAVGTGFLFNYTKNEYEQKIAELNRLIGALGEHLNDMKALRDKVPSFWDDEQGREVIRELNRTIQETEREMETVKTYVRTLQTVVTELDGSKTLMGETIKDLQSTLSAGIKG